MQQQGSKAGACGMWLGLGLGHAAGACQLSYGSAQIPKLAAVVALLVAVARACLHFGSVITFCDTYITATL